MDHISLRYLEKFCAQLKKIVPIYEELTEPPNTAAAAAAGQSREPGSGQSDSATLTSPSTAAAVAGGGEGGGTTKSVKPKPKRTARKTAKKTQAKGDIASCMRNTSNLPPSLLSWCSSTEEAGCHC